MRLRQQLKCKLHQARITYCNPEYVGSIEIGAELMERAGLHDGEHVHVWAVDHQARIETYAFRGPRGAIGLNGGAAHHFAPGDRVIVAAFELTDEQIMPVMLQLGPGNEVLRELEPFTVTGVRK